MHGPGEQTVSHILIGMKTARYWTRASGEAVNSQGGRIRITARGWSDDSFDSARRRAGEVARRVAQRIAVQPGEGHRYPYGDRPLPEPILSEFSDSEGRSAVITRNSYGAMVMNTEQMMFVDIDRDDSTVVPASPVAGLKSLFSSLFGKPAESPVKVVDPVVEAIGNVAERRRLSGRVYRTAGGYRVLITNRRFPVKSPETEALLNEFRADPLYVRLCRLQESFSRASHSQAPGGWVSAKFPSSFPSKLRQTRLDSASGNANTNRRRLATRRAPFRPSSAPAAFFPSSTC
jgi:hypothetical protein